MQKGHIFLIGFMGCGKSTVSKELSRLTGRSAYEMDQVIEEEEGMAIRDIFAQKGEEYFRGLETGLCRRFSEMEPAVVSCGGGTVMRPENVEAMRACGRIVLLTADPQTIFERVRYDTGRPLLNGHMEPGYIAELMEKRRPAYEAAADLIVQTDQKDPEQIAEEILGAIRGSEYPGED